ncbi:hypothetical protein RYX36_020518, partial [Vicia faba]
WTFSREFEVSCQGLNITPTTRTFFSFYEAKGMYKFGWVFVSAFHGRAIFSLYTSNYNDWKDKFLRVRGNAYCTKVIYEEDETYKLPIS